MAVVGESSRLTVVLNHVSRDRAYLVQARVTVHNDFPTEPIRMVTTEGGLNEGATNIFIQVHKGLQVLPGFVIARGVRPTVHFLGGRTVYTVHDVRIQQL
jgi:hypothetical protein